MNYKIHICNFLIFSFIIYTAMNGYAATNNPHGYDPFGYNEQLDKENQPDTDKINEELRDIPIEEDFVLNGFDPNMYTHDDLLELGIYQRGADFLVSTVIPDIVNEYPINDTVKDDIVVVEDDEYCYDYKLKISNLKYDVPFDEDSLTLELEKGRVSGYLSSPDATVSGDISFKLKNHADWDWDDWYCIAIPEFDITVSFDIKGIFADILLSLKKAGDSIVIDKVEKIDIEVTELDIDGGLIEDAIETVIDAINFIGEAVDPKFADINANLDDYVFDFAKESIEEGVKPPMKAAVNQSLVEAFKLYDSSSAYDIDEYGLTFNLAPSDLDLIDGKMGLAFDGEISPVNYINKVTSDPSGGGITSADTSRSNSYAYVSLSQLFMNEVMDSFYRDDLLKYSGSTTFDESFNLNYGISLDSAPTVSISKSNGIRVTMKSVNEAIEIYYSRRPEPIGNADISYDIEATLSPQIAGNAIVIDISDVAITNITVSSELGELGMSDGEISNFVTKSVTEFLDDTISGKIISQSFFVGDYELEVEEIENGSYYTTIYLVFNSKSKASTKSVNKTARLDVKTGGINYIDVGDNKFVLKSKLNGIINENKTPQTSDITLITKAEEVSAVPAIKIVESSPKQKETSIKKEKSKNKFVNRFLSKSKKIFNKKKFYFWR